MKNNTKKDSRTPFLKGVAVEYETISDIELVLRLSCANNKCKATTRVKLMKNGSSTGDYHNKKYGHFDIRNISFVCPKCQKAYDKYYKAHGYDKIFGMLPYNRALA
jgi:hypothetical protein